MEKEEYKIMINRYNKQKKRNISHLQIEDDPVDNYINSRLKLREQVQQYQEKKKKMEAEEQQIKELSKQIKEQVTKEIKDILKNLFK